MDVASDQQEQGLQAYVDIDRAAASRLGVEPARGLLDVLREDNRAIVRAASAASKAADYLLAFRPGAEAVDQEPEREAA